MKSTIYCLAFFSQLSLLLAGPPVTFRCLLWDTPCLTGKALAVSSFIATAIPHLSTKTWDPINIDYLHINENGFKFDMKNFEVIGMKDVIIDNVSIDTASRIVRLLFHTDLSGKSLYKTEGTLLTLPIYGEGNYTVAIRNLFVDMAIPFDIIKGAHGRDILDLKGYAYAYDVRDGAQFNLENLYYGDKELSKTMHQVLQQNWKLLTVQYGRYLFDKMNDLIFSSLRIYMMASPLDTIILY